MKNNSLKKFFVTTSYPQGNKKIFKKASTEPASKLKLNLQNVSSDKKFINANQVLTRISQLALKAKSPTVGGQNSLQKQYSLNQSQRINQLEEEFLFSPSSTRHLASPTEQLKCFQALKKEQNPTTTPKMSANSSNMNLGQTSPQQPQSYVQAMKVLQDKIKGQKEEIAQLEKLKIEIESVTNEKNKLFSEYEQQKFLILEYQELLNKMTEETQEIQNNAVLFQNEISHLKKQLEEKETKYQKLLSKQKKKLTNLKNYSLDLEKKTESIFKERDQLNSQINEVTSQLIETEKKLNQEQSENEKLIGDNQQLQNRAIMYEQKISDFQNEIMQLEQQYQLKNNEAEHKNEQLQKIVNEQTSQLQIYQATLTEKDQQIKSSRQALSISKREKKQQQQQNSTNYFQLEKEANEVSGQNVLSYQENEQQASSLTKKNGLCNQKLGIIAKCFLQNQQLYQGQQNGEFENSQYSPGCRKQTFLQNNQELDQQIKNLNNQYSELQIEVKSLKVIDCLQNKNYQNGNVEDEMKKEQIREQMIKINQEITKINKSKYQIQLD